MSDIKTKVSRNLKIFFWAYILIYIMLLLAGHLLTRADQQWKKTLQNSIDLITSYLFSYDTSGMPLVRGKSEGCLLCHKQVQGFSDAHKPEKIGCSSCHLGNVFETDKDLAHAEMIKIPGNLDDASRSCGQIDCHMGIDIRIKNSIMNTMSGVVNVNRFIFAETDSLNQLHRIEAIGNSAADIHLRNLCASCHLGKQKMEYGPVTELSRGGGCNACHLNYSASALQQLQLVKNKSADDSLDIRFHPSLDINISDAHCFGCHSRSGRISTNYQGWHETLLEPSEMPADTTYRLLDDGRVFEKVAADIHFERGLQCIDCHSAYEIMGDGKLYAHQEDQVKIRCQDCHFNGQANTIDYDRLDMESLKIAQLRQMADSSRVYLATVKGNIPLINTSYKKGKAVMYSKNSSKQFVLSSPAEICTKGIAHNRLSCSSCHSSWAPQCLGCHTEFDVNEKGADHLTGKHTSGAWIEWSGDFLAEPPTLGVISGDPFKPKNERIDLFIPGMILTLDKSAFTGSAGDTLFKRLFAPSKPHTTAAKGRTCKSCHNNPLAIGFGRGELIYNNHDGKGDWKFSAQFEKLKNDNLPSDAWTGFLDESKPGKSTRTNARSFNTKEQQKILRVGACLTCHDDQSNVMMRSLINFEELLKSVSTGCLIPDFNVH